MRSIFKWFYTAKNTFYINLVMKCRDFLSERLALIDHLYLDLNGWSSNDVKQDYIRIHLSIEM